MQVGKSYGHVWPDRRPEACAASASGASAHLRKSEYLKQPQCVSVCLSTAFDGTGETEVPDLHGAVLHLRSSGLI